MGVVCSCRVGQGVILVYDVTSQKSFSSLERWLEEVERQAGPHTRTLLLGNKVTQHQDP